VLNIPCPPRLLFSSSLFLVLSLPRTRHATPVNLILILTRREPHRAANYSLAIFLIFLLREGGRNAFFSVGSPALMGLINATYRKFPTRVAIRSLRIAYRVPRKMYVRRSSARCNEILAKTEFLFPRSLPWEV